MIVIVAVLAGLVLAVCVVLSKISIIGPTTLTALLPPRPAPPAPRTEPKPADPPQEDPWLVVGPVAMVGSAGCGVLVAATFLPDPLVLPAWLVLPFMGVAFLMLPLAVNTLRHRKQDAWQIFADGWPWAPLVFVAFALVAVSSFGGPGGVAQVQDGRYVLNNHGTLTDISHADYVRYESQDRRESAATSGALHAPAISLGISAHRRRRIKAFDPDPSP